MEKEVRMSALISKWIANINVPLTGTKYNLNSGTCPKIKATINVDSSHVAVGTAWAADCLAIRSPSTFIQKKSNIVFLPAPGFPIKITATP
jgi:hypothetical protein